MNAAAFRHLFNYHFTENRSLWKIVAEQLSADQFTQESAYSHGSVRDQIIHLINVDDVWFRDLQGLPFEEPPEDANLPDRDGIRKYWDRVEHHMRAYLVGLRDEMLAEKPLEGEDEALAVWQVLLHVVNHGTDHRAQILRLLSDLGVKTTSQDYVFYAYDHPV